MFSCSFFHHSLMVLGRRLRCKHYFLHPVYIFFPPLFCFVLECLLSLVLYHYQQCMTKILHQICAQICSVFHIYCLCNSRCCFLRYKMVFHNSGSLYLCRSETSHVVIILANGVIYLVGLGFPSKLIDRFFFYGYLFDQVSSKHEKRSYSSIKKKKVIQTC